MPPDSPASRSGASPIVAGLALAMLGGAPVDRLRNILFDEYQRLAPRQWSPDLPVRIVDIDDELLARFGQWPWPRSRIAELTDKLAAAGAAAIVFDIVFAEEDRLSPQNLLRQLPDLPERAGAGQGHRKAKSRRGRPARRGFRAGSGRRRRGARLRRQTAGTEDEVWLRHARRRSEAISLFLPRRDHAARPPRRRGQGSRCDHLYSRRRPDRAQTAARLRRRTAGRGAIRPLARRRSLARREPRRHDHHQGDQCLGGESPMSGTAIVAVAIGDLVIPTDRDGSVRLRYAGWQSRSPHRRLACPRRRGGRRGRRSHRARRHQRGGTRRRALDSPRCGGAGRRYSCRADRGHSLGRASDAAGFRPRRRKYRPRHRRSPGDLDRAPDAAAARGARGGRHRRRRRRGELVRLSVAGYAV